MPQSKFIEPDVCENVIMWMHGHETCAWEDLCFRRSTSNITGFVSTKSIFNIFRKKDIWYGELSSGDNIIWDVLREK